MTMNKGICCSSAFFSKDVLINPYFSKNVSTEKDKIGALPLIGGFLKHFDVAGTIREALNNRHEPFYEHAPELISFMIASLFIKFDSNLICCEGYAPHRPYYPILGLGCKFPVQAFDVENVNKALESLGKLYVDVLYETFSKKVLQDLSSCDSYQFFPISTPKNMYRISLVGNEEVNVTKEYDVHAMLSPRQLLIYETSTGIPVSYRLVTTSMNVSNTSVSQYINAYLTRTKPSTNSSNYVYTPAVDYTADNFVCRSHCSSHLITRVPMNHRFVAQLRYDNKKFQRIKNTSCPAAQDVEVYGQWLDKVPNMVYVDKNGTKFPIPQKAMIVYNPASSIKKREQINQRANRELKLLRLNLKEVFSSELAAIRRLNYLYTRLKLVTMVFPENALDPYDALDTLDTIRQSQEVALEDQEEQNSTPITGLVQRMRDGNYKLDVKAKLHLGAIDRAANTDSCYALVTTDVKRNWTLDELYTQAELSATIQGQHSAASCKSIFVASSFITCPERIHALLFVFNMCQMAYMYIQHKINQANQEQVTITLPEHAERKSSGNKAHLITTSQLINMLEHDEDFTISYDDDGFAENINKISPTAKAVLKALGPSWDRFLRVENYGVMSI